MTLRFLDRMRTLNTTVRYMRGRSIRNDRAHVLVACMPKSGSSFLTHAIGALPGFRVAATVQGYDRNEQELSELQLLRFHASHYATQNHVRYSAPLARLMVDFWLRPVVLTRNIYDVVVSMRDHIKAVSPIWPLAYVPDDLANRSNEEIEAFVADLMVPWYLNFYMSWRDCPKALWLRYEDLMADPVDVLRDLIDRLTLPVSHDDADTAIKTAQSTKLKTRNKGSTGRGSALSGPTRTRIRCLVHHYADTVEADPMMQALFLGQENVQKSASNDL